MKSLNQSVSQKYPEKTLCFDLRCFLRFFTLQSVVEVLKNLTTIMVLYGFTQYGQDI